MRRELGVGILRGTTSDKCTKWLPQYTTRARMPARLEGWFSKTSDELFVRGVVGGTLVRNLLLERLEIVFRAVDVGGDVGVQLRRQLRDVGLPCLHERLQVVQWI